MKKKVERVAKLISHYGFCSRRQAENFIISGKVKINGRINKQFVFKDQNGFGDYRLDRPFIGSNY